MAHEITATDKVAIVGERGWHGLGIQIPSGLSALEALTIAGLNWDVETSDTLTATFDGVATDCADEAKALRRSDTGEILGVVGSAYCPLPNSTLASLADGFGASDATAPQVTSAGSHSGGKKVWFCLRGETTVMGGDDCYTQLILANSHDGSGSLRIHPSATRIVCANTYAGSAADAHLGFAWRHTSGLTLKRDEIIGCVARWRERIAKAKDQADYLAAVEVDHAKVEAIFLAVYERQAGSVPLIPVTPTETRRKERAITALAEMTRIFDLERAAGCKPSAWLAANAATNWIQHTSGRIDAEQREFSRVLGLKAEQTSKAMATVLAMA